MTGTLPLFDDERKASGPVECLGQTFPSDEARREHYLAIPLTPGRAAYLACASLQRNWPHPTGAQDNR